MRMKNFKCEICEKNLGARNCKDKRCGKCCSDYLCSAHPSRKKNVINKNVIISQSIVEIDTDETLYEYSSDYDSEMEYNGDIIKQITKIICNIYLLPCHVAETNNFTIPIVLIDLIVEYIDNSLICCVCECYCEPEPYRCKNCDKYMCDHCSKSVFKMCSNTDCYYCRTGSCYNSRFDEYCKNCYPLFVKKCAKCKSFDDESENQSMEKCSICNRYFCDSCGDFKRTFSKCYEKNCRYCRCGNCYNVRLISNKCTSCAKKPAYDHVCSTNMKIQSDDDMSDESDENESLDNENAENESLDNENDENENDENENDENENDENEIENNENENEESYDNENDENERDENENDENDSDENEIHNDEVDDNENMTKSV